MRIAIVCCLFLVACGGDDAAAVDADPRPDSERHLDAGPAIDAAAAPDAAPAGSATITGTLAEQMVAPTTAFYATHPLGGIKVLVMAEGGEVCNAGTAATGLAAVVGFPCGPAEVATYPAGAPGADCAAAPYVWILVEGFDGEFPEYVAESGSITVTSIAPTLEGTFAADFGDTGALTGTFDAVVCP